MNKKIIFFVLFVVFLLGILFFSIFLGKNNDEQAFLKPYLTINNSRVNLSIADTPSTQAQGLSYQKILDKDSGMLFIFFEKKNMSFWMKDMNFPLDIVWISGNKIVKIDKNLPPAGSEPKKNYYSGVPVDYVLEVNGNFCDSNNIKVGDEVKYFLN